MDKLPLLQLCLRGATFIDAYNVNEERMIDFVIVGSSYALITFRDWWMADVFPGASFVVAPGQFTRVSDNRWTVENVDDKYTIEAPEDPDMQQSADQMRARTLIRRGAYLQQVKNLGAAYAVEPYNLDVTPWVDLITAQPMVRTQTTPQDRQVGLVDVIQAGQVIDTLAVAYKDAMVRTGRAPILRTFADAWMAVNNIDPLLFVENIVKSGGHYGLTFANPRGITSANTLAHVLRLSP